jgi:hypothetical protein
MSLPVLIIQHHESSRIHFEGYNYVFHIHVWYCFHGENDILILIYIELP